MLKAELDYDNSTILMSYFPLDSGDKVAKEKRVEHRYCYYQPLNSSDPFASMTMTTITSSLASSRMKNYNSRDK